MTTPAFSQSLARGQALFALGEFVEAHEAWEIGWRLTRGDERRVLQTLVQWAAALEQRRRGKVDGARRLITKAMLRLQAISEGFPGLDLDWLGDALVRTWAHLDGARLEVEWPPTRAAQAMSLELEHDTRCPACGERVQVSVAPEDAGGARYAEDCPCCCRPWDVTVHVEGGQVRVELARQGV